MQVLYIIFFIVITGVLLWVTLAGKDAYPFSHYPMFAMPHQVSRIKMYRIAIEKHSGEIEWWQHEAYRYPEIFGKKLSELYHGLKLQDNKTTMLYTMQKQRLLMEVVRLIEAQGNTAHYKALHIVEHSVNSVMDIQESTIEVIFFSKLTHGKVS